MKFNKVFIIGLVCSLFTMQSVAKDGADFYLKKEVKDFSKGILFNVAYFHYFINPNKFQCLNALAKNEKYLEERLIATSSKFSKQKVELEKVQHLYKVLNTSAGHAYLEKYLTAAKTTEVEERKKLRKQGYGGADLDSNFQQVVNDYAQQFLHSGSDVLDRYRQTEPACASTLNQK